MEENYDFFDIDTNDLVNEWITQPKLFFKWAEKLAKARRILDAASGALKVIKAEVDLAVRTHPQKYKIPKGTTLTEPRIANALIQTTKVKEASKIVRIKQYRVHQLEAIVKSLDQRKNALANIVSLHGQNYFATPRPTKETKKDVSEDIENSIAKTKRRKRRKRKD